MEMLISYRKALLISSPYRVKTSVPSTNKSRRKTPPIKDAIRMLVTRSLLVCMAYQVQKNGADVRIKVAKLAEANPCLLPIGTAPFAENRNILMLE